MSTLKVNSIEANTGSEIDINSTLGTIPSIVVSGVTTVSAGSTAAPSISPSGDSNTGIFFPDGDTVSIGEGGTEVVRVHSLGRVLVGTANTNTAGAPSNKGAKQFIYTAEGNGEWALHARHDSTTGNGLFVRAGNNSTTYTARFTGYDENNVHLNIDGLGRVTTPYQPAFTAYLSTNYSYTGGGSRVVIPFDAVVTNIGSHFNTSTNRFVAPVAGMYLFTASLVCNIGSSTTYFSCDIFVNAGQIVGSTGWQNMGAGYQIQRNSLIVYLSVNDYVDVRMEKSANDTINSANTSSFTGTLLG